MNEILYQKLKNELENNSEMTLLTKPIGFGWAKDRHFRTTLLKYEKETKVVLKRCWTKEFFEVESYAYRHLFKNMENNMPQLYSNISIDGDNWLILEDVGNTCADKTNKSDRMEMLKILGKMHGIGTNMLEKKHFDFILPKFYCDNEYQEKLNYLTLASNDNNLSIDQWLISFFKSIWQLIISRNFTILHGDTDSSNFIKNGDLYYTIDFERCKIGPVCLDFSKFSEYIENKNELECYVKSFNQVSNNCVSLNEIFYDAKLGEAYDYFHWLCYDIKNYFYPSYKEYVFNKHEFLRKINRLTELKNYFVNK